MATWTYYLQYQVGIYALHFCSSGSIFWLSGSQVTQAVAKQIHIGIVMLSNILVRYFPE